MSVSQCIGEIGEDSGELTEDGRRYSINLAKFIKSEHEVSHCRLLNITLFCSPQPDMFPPESSFHWSWTGNTGPGGNAKGGQRVDCAFADAIPGGDDSTS
jgi:hypothetical protein